MTTPNPRRRRENFLSKTTTAGSHLGDAKSIWYSNTSIHNFVLFAITFSEKHIKIAFDYYRR